MSPTPASTALAPTRTRVTVTLTPEAFEDVRECLAFLSQGHTHVRQFWHVAPDARARRALPFVMDAAPFLDATVPDSPDDDDAA